MKKSLIIANWKSNITKNEAKTWLEEVSIQTFPDSLETLILPPFTLLDVISGYIKVNDLSFKLGAQNISQFDEGPYTGEISASQIKEFADYVLIGHSERRSNFFESDEIIKTKVEKAIEFSLIPIICISSFEQARSMEFANNAIFAYEPLSAIGTGIPEGVNKVLDFSVKFKASFKNDLIYGGSVDSQNIKSYLELDGISGVLIGKESLKPETFINIIKNAI